jgi:hypothetical protein
VDAHIDGRARFDPGARMYSGRPKAAKTISALRHIDANNAQVNA